MNKQKLFTKIFSLFFMIFIANFAFAETPTHVWIDKNNGINSQSTTGTETQPFKSITFALMVVKDNLLVVHIKAGIYDNESELPIENEIFPITLREGIIIQGEATKEECVISGSSNSNVPIFLGEQLNNISIKNLTFKSMKRTGGSKNGAAIELISCSGQIDNCVFIENETSGKGGGLWLSTPDNTYFDITNCQFNKNKASTGAACYIEGNLHSNQFINNEFEENTNGGFYVNGEWIINENFINNSFSNNTGDAGFRVKQSMTVSNMNFSSNSFTNNKSRGFCVEKDLNTNIVDNIFDGNYVYSHGGGFYVTGNVNGRISNNQFINNYLTTSGHYGAGFYINGSLFDNINNNLFESNSAHSGYFRIATQMIGDIYLNIIKNNSISYNGFYIPKLIGNLYQNIFENNKNEAMDIGTMEGDFYDNIIIGTTGGRYVVYFGSFNGKIFNNIFSNNSISSHSIFYVNTTCKALIANNFFVNNSSANYGGALRIYGAFEGRIEKNLFSSNSSNIAGAIYLGSKGGNPVTISNNYFLNNSISGNADSNGDKKGSSIHSEQNIALLNNTFVSDGINDSTCLSLGNEATLSMVKNNIFLNCYSAILLQDELSIPIQFNNFFNISKDILKRNKVNYGNVLFFVEMNDVNSFFNNNVDSQTNLKGEILDKGTWTKDSFYQQEQNCTIFSDTTKNWAVDQWKGAFINLSGISEKEYHFMILSNTKNEIFIANNIVPTGFGKIDASYSIDDYRLKSNSLLKDAGTEDIGNIDITKDFEGEYRPQDSKPDIGADEFFTGKIAPSILAAEIPASEISSSSAVLNARLNTLGKNASYYFEYGTSINYGNNTAEMTVGYIQDYTTVSFLISNLEQDTLYHFRLIASNDDVIGAMGADQSFKTLRTNVIIKGNIKGSIAGYSSLNIKNAIVKLEGTDYETQTNANGDFILNDIVPGNYSVIIQSPGFVSVIQNMELVEGDTVSFDSIKLTAPSVSAIEAEVDKERLKWDALNDRKKGIPEAIEALKVSSGM